MLLRNWLELNPPPWRVSLFTMPVDADPSEVTAGQIHMLAHEVTVDEEGGTIIFYRSDGDAHLVLVEKALAPGVLEGGAWAGRYSNLQTPVEGFHPDVMLVVEPANMG
ncbi:hypothetical protein V3F56_03345 [Moorellaceae bacterium AZ2]